MQDRMRVVLILSLALVLLVSVAFAAPSLVDAPEFAEQLQLAGETAGDDEPEITIQEAAKEFGLTEADLKDLYKTWVPTVPDGEDSSFQAFIFWMDENDEPKDKEVVGPGTHYLKSIIKWTGKILNRANKKAKDQRSIDGEQPQLDRSQIAEEFGLTETELKDLYKLWVPKVPAGEDSSFQAFLDWMDENDEPEDEGVVGPGTHYWRTVAKWTAKILGGIIGRNNANKKNKRSGSIDGEEAQKDRSQIAAEFGLSETELEDLYKLWVSKVPAGEDDSFKAFVDWMNENDGPDDDGAASIGTHYWRTVAKWTAKIIGGIIGRNNANKKNKRSGSIDGEEAQKDRSQIAAADSGQALFEAYRKWLKAVGEGKDRTFQKFAEFFNIRKPRTLESELSDESPKTDKEKPADEETEKEVPVEESKPSDTNGGYSCEKNSPCNIENIVNEQFYFATTPADKFIQCDAWGGCHTLTCDEGLVWDDVIKTCGLRT